MLFTDRQRRRLLLLLGILLVLVYGPTLSVQAQSATEFPGTVLAADAAAGKLTVKKDEGGTRFTFVVNDKTQFAGPGLKSLADTKKGDRIVVIYVVNGTQYVAQKVTKK